MVLYQVRGNKRLNESPLSLLILMVLNSTGTGSYWHDYYPLVLLVLQLVVVVPVPSRLPCPV